MKVFISSVIGGFQQFRDAAKRGATALRHEVIRAEAFGAAPDSPQRVCLAGVREADVVILILGARYGEIQPGSGVSATHEEFREARERCDVLVFVQEGVTREPRQEDLLREVRDWASGHYTASFSTAEEIQDAVVAALHDLEMSRKDGDMRDEALVERARALVPQERGFASSALCLVLVGAPRQQVIRPVDIEKPDFSDRILQEAMFGGSAVFSTASGCDPRVEGDRLVLSQRDASILVDQTGSVRIVQPARATSSDDHSYVPVLIEEEVREKVERGLRFASWLLDLIDPAARLSRVAPLASLTGAGYMGWKTRAEHRRQPNTVQMTMRGDDALVMLSPVAQPRAALRLHADTLAEDLMVLLRRKVRQ